jgi:hypothetical protein
MVFELLDECVGNPRVDGLMPFRSLKTPSGSEPVEVYVPSVIVLRSSKNPETDVKNKNDITPYPN